MGFRRFQKERSFLFSVRTPDGGEKPLCLQSVDFGYGIDQAIAEIQVDPVVLLDQLPQVP